MKVKVLVAWLIGLAAVSGGELSWAIRMEDNARVAAALAAEKISFDLDDERLSPLLHATVANRADWVKALIDRGARPDMPGQALTPLWAAAANGETEICRILLAAGASVSFDPADLPRDIFGEPHHFHPLVAAIRSGNVETFNLLRAEVPDLDIDALFPRDGRENWPVMDALRHRQPAMAGALVLAGCREKKPTARPNDSSHTPILVAALAHDPVPDDLVALMLKRGNSPFLPYSPQFRQYTHLMPWDGLTAAVRAGNLKWTSTFIANREITDANYRLWLTHYAHVGGSSEVISLVKSKVGEVVIPPLIEPPLPESDEDQTEIARLFLPRANVPPEGKRGGKGHAVAVIATADAAGEGDALGAGLSGIEGWTVIEREDFASLLAEKDLAGVWAEGAQDLSGLGDRLSADVLLLVSKLGSKSDTLLRVEAVDVRTGLDVHRLHLPADQFEPKETAERIANEVAAVLERFSATGGKVTAVTVLATGTDQRRQEDTIFARIFNAGLIAQIDATPRAVAMTRRQMQPLLEEQALKGTGSLWQAAWTLDSGVSPTGDGRLKVTLRATRGSDGRQVDASAEGPDDDPGGLAATAWRFLAKMADIPAAGTAPARTSNREAAQLLAEVRWLLAARRPADAVPLAEAAILLQADPMQAYPLRLRAITSALPFPPSIAVAGKYRSQEVYFPLPGRQRLFPRLDRFTELARVADETLALHGKQLALLAGTGQRDNDRYAFTEVWQAFQRLIDFRSRIPDWVLTRGQLEQVREFDQEFARAADRFFKLLPDSLGQLNALSDRARFMSIIHWRKFPKWRDLLADRMADVLVNGENHPVGTRRPGDVVAEWLAVETTDARPWLEDGMATALEKRLVKESAPLRHLWLTEIRWMKATNFDRGRLARELGVLKAGFSMDQAVASAGLTEWRELGRFIASGDSERPVFIPRSADAWISELVIHPKGLGEWLRQPAIYANLINRRARSLKDPGAAAREISAAAASAGAAIPTHVDLPPTPRELLAKSGAEGINRGGLSLVMAILQLPPDYQLPAANSRLPRRVEKAGFFGIDREIPEVRHEGELSCGSPVSLNPLDAGTRFLWNPSALSHDGRHLWLGGILSSQGDGKLAIWSGTAGPLALSRLSLDDGQVRHFSSPTERSAFHAAGQIAAGPAGAVFGAEGRRAFHVSDEGQITDWGDDVVAANPRLGGRQLVAWEDEFFLISKFRRPDGGTREFFRVFRLKPGLAATVIAATARKPPQSPLDGDSDEFDRLLIEDHSVTVLANAAHVARLQSLTKVVFDPARQSWGAPVQGAEVQKWMGRDAQAFWQSHTLPGGMQVTILTPSPPGGLQVRTASGEVYVPLAMDIPRDSGLSVRCGIKPDGGGNVREEMLSLPEAARTAFAQPFLIADHGDSFFLALGFGMNSKAPYLWKLPKGSLEKRIAELMASDR